MYVLPVKQVKKKLSQVKVGNKIAQKSVFTAKNMNVSN